MKNQENNTKVKYVAYYRVSTRQQGDSKLGLEAQKQAVMKHVADRNGVIIGEFNDIQSGKSDERIGFQKALELARKEDAILIVAKLDRLSRKASTLMLIKDMSIKLEVVDLPELNTMTLGIFATMAQYERELISQRTKAALQELKKKGKKLGNTKIIRQKKVQRKAQRKKRENLIEKYRHIFPILKDLKRQGLKLREITERLNQYGIKTIKGKNFTITQVHRCLKYMEKWNIEI